MSEEKKTEFSPPPGWRLSQYSHTFSGRAGPFYFLEEGKIPGVGFFSEPHHANLGGVVHGGALMTLADMSLFDICFREAGMFPAVTVTMNAEFVRPGPIGSFIEAAGEVVKSGKSMMFARGLVTAEGKTLLSFSGSIKRL